MPIGKATNCRGKAELRHRRPRRNLKQNEPIQDARRIKIGFDDEPDRKGYPEPVYNAENHAGATTGKSLLLGIEY